MKEEVSAAVLRLQRSLLRDRIKPWRAEQAEEALNGLLAKPDRTGDPFHLHRNALSDARKKLRRRAALFAGHAADVDACATESDGGYEALRADVVDVVWRTSSEADRRILAIAMDGGTAGDVAETLGIDYEVAKVRLSRARHRARIAWMAS